MTQTTPFWESIKPKPCERCGAEPLADHDKDCNYLAALKAQAYPQVLDLNGLPWWQNIISKQQDELNRLRKELTDVKGN